MKKRTLLFAVALHSAIACIAQHKDDGHPNVPHLNGSVLSFIQYTDTNSLRKAHEQPFRPWRDEYTYDVKGRCTSHLSYFVQRATVRTEFSYDDQERTEKIKTYRDQRTDSVAAVMVYHYRPDSTLSEKETINGQVRYTAKYDRHGEICYYWDTMVDMADHRGSKHPITHSDSFENIYNDAGKLILQRQFQADTLYQTKTFTYNKWGNEITNETRSPHGKIIARYVYVYDSLGREIENTYFISTEGYHSLTVYNKQGDPATITYLKPSGTLRAKISYQYKYDKHHNWIERKTTFVKEAFKVVKDKVSNMLEPKPMEMKGTYVTHRIITYY